MNRMGFSCGVQALQAGGAMSGSIMLLWLPSVSRNTT